MTALFAITLAASGLLTGLAGKAVQAEYDSSATMGDAERCLIDVGDFGPPLVYRQPDRPDDVTLIWLKWGEFAGAGRGRVDLHRTATGTHVRSWMPAKQVAECAPKAG
ncbi:hypothetical protein KZ810_12975 [Sphingomonas sp. RHCKR47]|uniref:hypothetical protein n=1 Tax=Sphingomonas citricola TaxID=2862498 RepID=UPI001CA4FFF1|nr:hypothetical protein [Sphingomonas citricola]MBW6524414.1 hypothetical protein [Sphingomonas citricola]